MAINQPSASDLQAIPNPVQAPVISTPGVSVAPLNVGQLFISAYQDAQKIVLDQQKADLLQQQFAAQQEQQSWENQYLRPLKLKEAELGLANTGASIATKAAQLEYYKARAQNETVKAATQQSVYGTIDQQIQGLFDTGPAPAAVPVPTPMPAEGTGAGTGFENLLPGPNGEPQGSYGNAVATDPLAYAKSLTDDPKDQTHIAEIVTMAKNGDFDGLKKLSPIDQEYALRGAGMVDADGKPLPPEQWQAVQAPTAPTAVQPAATPQPSTAILGKVQALEQTLKALPPSDPKAQTARLALATVKNSPQYAQAANVQLDRTAVATVGSMFKFGQAGQTEDFAASHPNLAFSVKFDANGNAIDIVDPATGQPLPSNMKRGIAIAMQEHAKDFKPGEAKAYQPPASLISNIESVSKAAAILNSPTATTEEKQAATAELKAAQAGIVAHSVASPQARAFVATTGRSLTALNASTAPPATPAPSPAATSPENVAKAKTQLSEIETRIATLEAEGAKDAATISYAVNPTASRATTDHLSSQTQAYDKAEWSRKTAKLREAEELKKQAAAIRSALTASGAAPVTASNIKSIKPLN
jgi:hypothetical protein